MFHERKIERLQNTTTTPLKKEETVSKL